MNISTNSGWHGVACPHLPDERGLLRQPENGFGVPQTSCHFVPQDVSAMRGSPCSEETSWISRVLGRV